MKERKAVFFDIDGTLFEQGKEVPESAVRAIHKLRENGHLAFVCSGRSRIMVPESPILSIGFDGVIAACGMYASYGNKVLFDDEMTHEQLKDILPTLKSTETMYILEGTEYIYYDEQTIHHAIDDWYVQSIKSMVPERFKVVPECIGEIHANKISIQVPKDRMEEVTERAKRHYQLLLHEENIAEIVPHGYTKAGGIRRVCERLGIVREDTIAVGDSINDIEMLRYAQIGIVMGNGTQIAKDNADYITTGLYEDGIWNAMEHFGLI
ncbi:MAG: Cof-type HAD-IIB family hydrolase [Lachnospiraceae bacterium]|nr:Cof-type HAD-IIB family hydrolase [Lachnospiraceae bacterium]